MEPGAKKSARLGHNTTDKTLPNLTPFKIMTAVGTGVGQEGSGIGGGGSSGLLERSQFAAAAAARTGAPALARVEAGM